MIAPTRAFPLLVIVPVRSAHEAEPLFLSSIDSGTVLDRTLADGERQRDHGDVTLIVTTDDPRICDAVTSRDTGWHVRLRSADEVASGYFHALASASRAAETATGKRFGSALLLEPSHPFRPQGLIRNALDLYARQPELETVVAVVREYGNLWTKDSHQGLTRIHTPEGRNFFREMAGLCLLTSPAAINQTTAMGANVGFVVVEEQWALIDIHEPDDVALAQRFHGFLISGTASSN